MYARLSKAKLVPLWMIRSMDEPPLLHAGPQDLEDVGMPRTDLVPETPTVWRHLGWSKKWRGRAGLRDALGTTIHEC